MNARKAPERHPSAPLHAFTPDPDTPADPYSQQQVCKCGKPGREGDDQHPLDGPLLVAAFDDTAQVLPPTHPDDRSDEWIGGRPRCLTRTPPDRDELRRGATK